MLKSFHHALLAAGFTLAVFVHAQDQSGFISMDCGMKAGSEYNDETTGIKYISDESFIDTGTPGRISPEFQTPYSERQFTNVRSFPDKGSKRNCYRLKPSLQGTKNRCLIRARFMYGNYDNKSVVPEFDLYLGIDLWETVILDNASSTFTTEIIHVPSTKNISVCLLDTGRGTPFISSLELRLLNSSIYTTARPTESLILQKRYDLGSTSNQSVRYPNDIYDRIWVPKNYAGTQTLMLADGRILNGTEFQVPLTVIRSAIRPVNATEDLIFPWEMWGLSRDPALKYYTYWYFAEVEVLNQTRKMKMYCDGGVCYDSFSLGYLDVWCIYDTEPIEGGMLIEMRKSASSDPPPIVNAIEIYMTKEFSQVQTHQNDVDSIMNIKSIYGVKKNWQGDPCAPVDYKWDGLDCNFQNNNSLKIVSLDMSSSGLTGKISTYFANLTSLKYLDLSDNRLSGTIPEILARLPSLKTLNLNGNNLRGPIPAGLLEKQKNGHLLLSVEGNRDLNIPVSFKENKKYIVPVVAAVVSVSVLSTAIAILWSFKRRKQEEKWLLSLIVVGAALVVPLLCCLCYLTWRKRKTKVERMNQLRELRDKLSPPTTYGTGKSQEKDESMKQELKIFDFQTIVTATNNFSMASVLGKGGFGSVYKGKLLDGQEIAIKRLSKSSAQGVEEFQNEANLIAKLQHTNLVRLLGCSLHGEERILVYEYMPNKSLDFFIFDSQRKYLLDWKTRFSIIEGIAQGLVYLHKYSRLKVIHRDLKASNILLDDQMNPKISDFGMARIFRMNESIANTNKIAGTYGYMSPEYAMNGIVSIKTDVYSFGVLVLEILSGKKNNSFYHLEHQLNLVGYAWQQWNGGKGLELKDPALEEPCPPNEVLRCLHVGLLCVQDHATDRPTMSDVVSMLANESLLLPEPKQPAFYVGDTSEVVEISGYKSENYTINDVTMSVMEAR